MIDIADGKYAKTRKGDRVGPVKRVPANSLKGGFYYKTPEHPLGHYANGRKVESVQGPDDLIAEWTDGPVRTVTRTVTETTIEPGVYGYVHVGHQMKPGTASVYVRDDHMTASELKAAAAVLLELAGALDHVA